MEERKEHMISPTISGKRTAGITFRVAHFLSPTVTSDDGEVPSRTISPHDLKFNFSKKQSVKVKFPGWKQPPKDWGAWVERMYSLHHFRWKRAGICDAIMNSTHIIHRNNELIHGFAEKWCPDTNTFLFPWGETTITLEDVMIIGGYSVLGDPVFSPIESPESEEVEKKLLDARSELNQTAAKKACQGGWLKKFMNSGSEIEHEAFLALWLSRFVFPTKSCDDTIGRHVLNIAIHLARGTKIALAPAVLASLYANLSEMKRALVISGSKRLQKNGKGTKKDEILEVSISAPFQLVQIWTWERFVSLRPNPLPFETDQPRFAKWHNLRLKDIGDVKLSIEKAGDLFLWRPYAVGSKSLLVPHGIYKEEARWLTVGSSIDEEQEVLLRWLTISELVGIDSNCIEQYLPHRVAMQFGLDQDVPGPVARVNSSQIMAWENYNREIRDGRLYVPSRLFESDVTTRYLQWWKNCRIVSSCNPVKTNALGVNSNQKGLNNKMQSSLLENSTKKRKKISELEKSSNKKKRISKCSKSSSGKNLKDGAVLSSVFSSKSNDEEMPLSALLEKSAKRRKKISKLEKSSNKSRKILKLLKISTKKNLKDNTVASSGFSHKCNKGRPHPEYTDGCHQIRQLPTNASGRKNKGPNVITLTGSDFKKAFGNQMRPNSTQKVVESENGSAKDKNLENGGAKKVVGSTGFLSSSEKKLNDRDAVVGSGCHNHKEMPYTDASGIKDKGSNMINLAGLEHKNATFADEMRPDSMRKMVESEKGRSSKRGSECEDQVTSADSKNKFINSNTKNGRKCRLDALKDLLIQWETHCSNLERIVAEYRRNHAHVRT
ncbi:OLC1v1022769C1 [Oldenlandia corymbosa var. corymbosa]|uniref:OLC1v1022769C1 n=1 Tax=Oldenlandia corymbosa var. corymbosa TaxID=529605 RepID=A0AAV1C287_OLDCO|nr:OLC1v1022769C1 [Oldenlandia corymbosa var. corymbosa]